VAGRPSDPDQLVERMAGGQHAGRHDCGEGIVGEVKPIAQGLVLQLRVHALRPGDGEHAVGQIDAAQ
jgi:hypothetical protein